MRIPIETIRLPNGLFVTLSEDHTAPIVAVNLWYHVGSANEPPGRTGFAHLFEHMLFQGSADVEANEHFELVQRAGGTLNGSTWLERTNYFETVPSNQLELALWLEANRMGKLLPAMTQQKLDTQREVVMNERRWTMDNQPYGTWMEKLPALCFPPEHPFHHSLMGSMEDLPPRASMTSRSSSRRTTRPTTRCSRSPATSSLPRRRRLVENIFGAIPRGAGKPPLPDMSLPPVFGQWKREVVPDEIMLPRLFLAFRSPAFGTSEYYAASVCGAVLGLRNASRLRRRLVRERQVAADASAFTYDLSKGADLLVVDVTARPGISGEQLEQEVAHEIDAVVRDGVIRRGGRACGRGHPDDVRVRDAAGDERADRISMFATYLGDPTKVNDEVDRYREVTARRGERVHPRATRRKQSRESAVRAARCVLRGIGRSRCRGGDE